MYSLLESLSSREEPTVRILAFGIIFFYSFFVFWIGVESHEIIKGPDPAEQKKDHQQSDNTEGDRTVYEQIILFNSQKDCGCQIKSKNDSNCGVRGEETGQPSVSILLILFDKCFGFHFLLSERKG